MTYTDNELKAAEDMRKAIADNLQRWVDALIEQNGGKPTIDACNFASARVVAQLTTFPAAHSPHHSPL